MCTPKAIKIYQILRANERKLCSSDMQPKPYGGGNPYYYCSSCRRSMIEVSYMGHYNECEFQQLENKIKTLNGQYIKALSTFIEKREFDKPSFKNYLWFKKDKYVEGLQELIQEIEKRKL